MVMVDPAIRAAFPLNSVRLEISRNLETNSAFLDMYDDGGHGDLGANDGVYGVVVPAQTPRAIIDLLNRDLIAALNNPKIKDILFHQGLDTSPSTPEEFGNYIKSEIAKWAKVVKASGAKAE